MSEARVMIALSDHWLVGAVPSKDIRIQDVLNDGNTDFVHLVDVELCPHAKGASCVTRLSHAVIPKCKVELVVLATTRHEAPEKRWNNFAVKAATTHVFAMVRDYYVQGELRLPAEPRDSMYVLTHQLSRFFPVTQPTLTGPGARQLSVPVLFVNRDYVNCFYVGEPDGIEDGPGNAPASNSSGEAEHDLQDLSPLAASVEG